MPKYIFPLIIWNVLLCVGFYVLGANSSPLESPLSIPLFPVDNAPKIDPDPKAKAKEKTIRAKCETTKRQKPRAFWPREEAFWPRRWSWASHFGVVPPLKPSRSSSIPSGVNTLGWCLMLNGIKIFLIKHIWLWFAKCDSRGKIGFSTQLYTKLQDSGVLVIASEKKWSVFNILKYLKDQDSHRSFINK